MRASRSLAPFFALSHAEAMFDLPSALFPQISGLEPAGATPLEWQWRSVPRLQSSLLTLAE